jgi:hypothetical protein
MLTLKHILLFVMSTVVVVGLAVTASTLFKKRMLYKKYGLKPGSRVESRRQRRLRETQDKMFEEFK